MIPCLTWMQHLWKQLLWEYRQCSSSGTSISSLPDEIIINILSRLPTQSVLACKLVCSQWLHLCSTPRFAEIQVANVTPVLLAEDRSSYPSKKDKPALFALEGFGKNARFKKVRLQDSELIYRYKFQLFSSCNGILIFLLQSDMVYEIFNPVTRANYRFHEQGLKICGFFFHESERDYKLLLYEVDELNRICHYYLFGLSNKDKRKLVSSPYMPMFYRTCTYYNEHAVVACGAVFWMVICFNNSELTRECSKSIMMFNLSTENFDVMPHPGSSCLRNFLSSDSSMHQQMRLLEMDGRVSLCNVCEKTIEVWVLKDFDNWMWVKKYLVKLDRPFDHERSYWAHPIVAIHSGHLFLNWERRGLFMCDLASSSIWKLERNLENAVFYATKYASSFVSF